MGVETFHHLKSELSSRGLVTAVGDEGGFAPNLPSNEAAIELILEAEEKSGHKIGETLFLAIDAAATSCYNAEKDSYYLQSDGKELKTEEMIEY